MISRRNLFWLLLAGSLTLPQSLAYAEDGDGGGDDGGGDDGGGDDGGGDDGGGDDGGGDDGGGDEGSGDSGEDDGGEDDDQDRALKAVKNNRAATLKEILAIVRKKYDGEIVRVSLRGSGANLTYRIKLLDEDNRLIEVVVNAVSRRIVRTKGT
ncbi:MAG: PepSY domain-containing protein [Aestuariivirga sp.]